MSTIVSVLVLFFYFLLVSSELKFRHDWSAGELFTPLGKTISDHQTNCTSQVHYHRQNNWGMGSDIHTWSQAICNSMQVGATLLQLDEHWIWNDAKFCPSSIKQPLGCYFNVEKYCPNSKVRNPRIITFKHDYNRCPKYITDDKTRQEFRAAAMEFLFSKVNKIDLLRHFDLLRQFSEIFATLTYFDMSK